MPESEGTRRWFVDRREGEWWVVLDEGGRILELPVWLLPSGTHEGDVLEVEAAHEDGARRLTLRPDREATDAARRKAKDALARLRREDPRGDIDL